MLPPDHAPRTCQSCGSGLLYRADIQPDMLVVYSTMCLWCSGGTLPLPQNRLPVRIEAGEMRYGTKSV